MHRIITTLNLPIEEYYNKVSLDKVFTKLSQGGIRLRELEPTMSIDDVNILVQSSDLIIIPGPNVFLYYGDKLLSKIISYYNSGGSILYEVDPNITEEQNEFLAYFKMSYEGIRLRPITGYNVPFANTGHSFRDRYLYKEIDQIIVTQPNHIKYWGNSQPILISNGNFSSIDGKTDLISEFPSNNITPIAIQENENKGMFLCVNGFIDINDKSFHRDDIEKNLKFLCNLYEMLLGNKSRYDLAYSLYRSIEQNLIATVIAELKKEKGTNWRELIPTKVVESILGKNPGLVNIEEGIDFIQIKKIIENNWSLFENNFSISDNIAKKKALAWMDSFNEIRKIIAHPVKDINNEKITYDTIEQLRIRDNKLRVWREAQLSV